MGDSTQADGGTQRITDNLSLTEVEVGDRIDPAIIPRTDATDVGDRINAHLPRQADDDGRTYDVVLIANRTDDWDDTQTALIHEPGTGLFARISGHTSSGAWNQHERDWKVRDVGSEFAVDDYSDLDVPESELGDDPDRYVSEWLDIVSGEWTMGECIGEIEDLDGNSLRLRDIEGRRVWIQISLEGDD